MSLSRRAAKALARFWHMRAWRGDVPQRHCCVVLECVGEDAETCCCLECTSRRETAEAIYRAYSPAEAGKLQRHWAVKCTSCGLRLSFAVSCLPFDTMLAAQIYATDREWELIHDGKDGALYHCPGCAERYRS